MSAIVWWLVTATSGYLNQALSLPVDNNHAGEGAEGEHPEPEEDVDSLVHFFFLQLNLSQN